MNEKQERIEKVNRMVRVIGSCGRQFFCRNGVFAEMEMDQRGRLWWIDEYTSERIYLHYPYWDRGFSHGGTLKGLVKDFKHYVMTGKPMNNSFGKAPDWSAYDSNYWGYPPDDMKFVWDAAAILKDSK